MIRKVILFTVFYACCSCSNGKVDLAMDPDAICRRPMLASKMSLKGIELGAEFSRIQRSKIKEENLRGWVTMNDQTGYKEAGGRVVAFRLGPKLIRQLKIRLKKDFVVACGQPDEKMVVEPDMELWRYKRGLRLYWCAGRGICEVIVGVADL